MAVRRSSFFKRLPGRRPAPPEPAAWDPRSRGLISPWEIPLDRELAAQLSPGSGYGAAYFPSQWGSIPEAAAQALTELISVRRPHDMLVAPAGIRRVGDTDIYCPTRILAAGDHGVALWVDDLPFDRVVGVLAYRDIRMVEHRWGADSAHLAVIGATRRFTLHYRRPWRGWRGPKLEELLMRIRLRAAGPLTDLGQHDGHRGDVEAATLAMELGISRVVASFSADGRSKWTPWKRDGQRVCRTVALTDRELVVARTVAARSVRDGGRHILAVPRRHLRGLSVAGTRLHVDAEATHDFTLGAAFARRVVRELSGKAGQPSSLAHPVVTLMSVRDPEYDQYSWETSRVPHRGPS